jgi:hypothetical protein
MAVMTGRLLLILGTLGGRSAFAPHGSHGNTRRKEELESVSMLRLDTSDDAVNISNAFEYLT